MNRDRIQTCSVIIVGILLSCFIAAYDVFYKEPIDVYTSSRLESSEEIAEKRININTATMDELMTVEGVGEVTAKRIIEYREAHGGFKFLEELSDIKGIGSGRYEKMKEYFYAE